MSVLILDKEYEEYIQQKEEIERLNNIINEINILIKHDYFKARELKEEIQRSNLYQGDYPIAYYHAEWLEDITDIYLNKIQEIREVIKSE